MIKVIDNALSDDMFEKCFSFLNPDNTVFDLYNEKIKWNISRDIFTEKELGSVIHSTYQMHHMLFWSEGKSDYYDSCLAALDSIVPEKSSAVLYRMKLNALFNNTKVTNGIINVPHCDLQEPHLSFLLYLNESDGDTVFYKESWNVTSHPAQLTEIQRVSPKKNRAVISDGHYHASQNPTNSQIRLVLNAVWHDLPRITAAWVRSTRR